MSVSPFMPPPTPTFFVDYELGTSESGAPQVGFAFRVGNSRLGDLNVEVGARAVLDALVPILRHDGDRRDDALYAMPRESLFRRLEVGVIIYADPGIDAGTDWSRFLRFVALPRQLSTFRGWSAYLIEDSASARLIWRDPERTELLEGTLAIGEMESALRAFGAELEAHLDKPHSLVPRSGERFKSDADIVAPASARARDGSFKR